MSQLDLTASKTIRRLTLSQFVSLAQPFPRSPDIVPTTCLLHELSNKYLKNKDSTTECFRFYLRPSPSAPFPVRYGKLFISMVLINAWCLPHILHRLHPHPSGSAAFPTSSYAKCCFRVNTVSPQNGLQLFPDRSPASYPGPLHPVYKVITRFYLFQGQSQLPLVRLILGQNSH